MTGVVVAVLFAAIVTSGRVELADGQPSASGGRASVSSSMVQVAPIEVGTEISQQDAGGLPDVVAAALWLMFYALAITITALVIRFVWRHRPNFRWPHRDGPPPAFDVLDEVVAATIAADAEAQHAALRTGAPRNAIVECWLRLEQAVVDAGVAPVASDTSAEFTQRVLAAQDVDPDALLTLATLYREARFSHHVMTEGARVSAIDALTALHTSLDRSGHRVGVPG